MQVPSDQETALTPVRKCAPPFRLRRELEAIEYVRRHTSLPVPRIVDSHLDVADTSEDGWVLMEKLPGKPIGEAWPDMTEQCRARVLTELENYIKELHALPQPPSPSSAGWVGSCTGGPAYDDRVDSLAPCGPFRSVAAFHNFLVAPITKLPRPEWVAEYRQRLNDKHRVMFIHAHLSREAILVDPDTGMVTGIVDWDMAGFWPEWWEYRKAMVGGSQRWWAKIVHQIMPTFEMETEADMDMERFQSSDVRPLRK